MDHALPSDPTGVSFEAEALRVAVLMGGRSAEREVSLHTGQQVVEALSSLGVDVLAIDAGEADFIHQLEGCDADACFIALHGRYGEDGTIQGLLELLDMPYVGSGVLASAAAMDKVISKHLFAQAGLKSPDYLVLRADEAVESAQARRSPRRSLGRCRRCSWPVFSIWAAESVLPSRV